MQNEQNNKINQNMFFIALPQDVDMILDKLANSGYEGYVVGGCIRDIFLNKVPKDWDICTNATPEQIIEVFSATQKDKEVFKIVPTGIKHGTVTIYCGGVGYEVTTYRVDGDYSDHRHPNKTTFSSALSDDLSRRDFTLNTLCYNHSVGLVDVFAGLNDLNKCIVKCNGKPQVRFNEDALRILRALRFVATIETDNPFYGFKIDEEASQAILDMYEDLRYISKERIRDEFCKILAGKYSTNILHDYAEVFLYILGYKKDIDSSGYIRKLKAFKEAVNIINCIPYKQRDISIMLSIILDLLSDEEEDYICDAVGENIFDILKKLKFNNKIQGEVKLLVGNIGYTLDISQSKPFIRFMLHKLGNAGLFKKWIIMEKAIYHCYNYDNMLENVKHIEKSFEDFDMTKECYSLSQLKINGDDLKELGVTDGKVIGIVLNNLLQRVMNEEIENTKEALIGYLKNTHYFMEESNNNE